MDEEQVSAEPPVVEPKRKGGFKKILVLGLALLVMAGGGGWWLLGGSGAKAEAGEVRLEERGIVPLETFLVNLSDPGGNRFLKVTLQLVVDSEVAAKEVEESPALLGHARSAILELLTEQSAQALITTDGKTKLKDAIKTRVAGLLKKQKVLDVLFSEFVVQF